MLTRDELRFKQSVEQEWSELAYKGLWWDPLKEGLETYIQFTQKRVNGTVTLNLYKGSMNVSGRESPFALYNADLASFDTTTFDQNESTGMVRNFGLQSKMYQALKSKL